MKTEQQCFEYLEKISTPQLSENDKAFCEGKLTLQNIWEALNSMKNGKTPGNDGLTKELYVCFSEELGSLLLKSLNHSHTVGELSTSQKQAVITLTEKKGRDKRLVKNWRPISLMNVDVNRLEQVLPNLINFDQTAYVKGRFIGESIRLIDDILYHTEQENIDGVLFAANIEKAFDSAEHNFIFASLKRFGFGDEFIKWIRTLLFNASSCVMNNGFSAGYFSIERGTRQGDPLSAYILCLEILFIQIRSDSSIKGFKFNNTEIKLTAFADDTTFLVKDVQSLRRILKLSKTFEIFSSLKFNVEKCEACWIGRSRNKHTKPIQCKWISLIQSSIKILGAHFTYNKQLDEKMNFYQLIIDSRTLLNIWKQRWLSLAGKIQTFKSLIASRPVYIATMKNPPPFVIEELQALHKDFIWGGRSPKIKHSTLIGSYEKGGFKDIDLTSKFKSLKDPKTS